MHLRIAFAPSCNCLPGETARCRPQSEKAWANVAGERPKVVCARAAVAARSSVSDNPSSGSGAVCELTLDIRFHLLRF